ncbi:MAG: hypothetical protein QOF26_1820 [Baekduia sp.]|nr:hypothetical protein [Baekduia sp.]
MLSVSDSSLLNNRAGAGGTGGDGGGGTTTNGAAGGVGGGGGGIWNAGSMSVVRSAISANAAGRGGNGGTALGGAPPHTGGLGGDGGYGGGVYDASSTSQTVANSTISGNAAGGGGAGSVGGGPMLSDRSTPGNGGSGGGGGGVVTTSAILTLLNLTISSNQVGAGGDAPAGGTPGSIGGGGGINMFGAATVRDTIVAGNSGGNCLGAVAGPVHNLSFPAESPSTCGTTGFVVADPKLGPLQDNGGPTPTVALGAGSAAVDQIPTGDAGCPAVDQRGVTRPQGPGCDIGAFERDLPPQNPALPTVSGTPPSVGQTPPPAAAPVASRLTISPTAFAAAPSGPSAVAAQRTKKAALRKRGATIGYTLDTAATVRFTIRRRVAGRTLRSKGKPTRCVAPSKHNSAARKCQRTVTLPGAFTTIGTTGRHKLQFSGRLNGHKLAPGRYTLVATPTANNTSGRAITAAFRIIR